MSSNTRWALDQTLNGNRFAVQTIAANATTAFDFGTPNDINLAADGYEPGDRVLVVLTAKRAAGTTDTLTFTIQDAPDSSGSIGTPAAATTHGTIPAFAAASGAVQLVGLVTVLVKAGRPWLRVNAVHAGGGTDSFQCHAIVCGVPSGI